MRLVVRRRCLDRHRRCLGRVEGKGIGGPAGGAAAALEAEAPSDLEKPGGELRLSAEVAHAFEGGEESVLEHLARVVLATAKTQAEAEDLLLVALQDLVERRRIAGLGGREQMGIR